MEKQTEEYIQSSPLDGGSAAYVEDLYEQYLEAPETLSSDWQQYFAGLPQPEGHGGSEVSHAAIKQYFLDLARRPVARMMSDGDAELERKQARVSLLISIYRNTGHRAANLDPLALNGPPPRIENLELSYHGLSEADLDTTFSLGNFVGPKTATLREILGLLQATYTGNIGFEYMHIADYAQTAWMQQRIEAVCSKPAFTKEKRQHILGRLTAAEGLAKYLGSRYVGQKRFGLEGGESLIPALDEIIQRGGKQGVKDVVIGMAHRGRLNVLVNILGKSPAELFDEFEGKSQLEDGTGDVKYHQGFSSDMDTPGGVVHLALAFNPSHLEIIDPVVEGAVRARQNRRGDSQGDQVLPILIHGDSAFSGQGVVMETFSLSQARHYKTGGTVHIIINNQVGFTTSDPRDMRSSLYSSDVAKMVQAPVFHVNADDPEAVIFVSQIALDYRNTFKRDVVIDLVCYRRHGHNEADEPSITQPLMYQTIRKHPSTWKQYSDRLVNENVVSRAEVETMAREYRDALDARRDVVHKSTTKNPYLVDWTPYFDGSLDEVVDTTLTKEEVALFGERMITLPEDVTVQPQVKKEFAARKKMVAGELPLNWGCAETLAYARLVQAGHRVRLSGQDCGRGTFSHRYAMVYCQKTGKCHIPLQSIDENQADFEVINSVLSEAAVLGFEYGYSTTDPESLVIWEAQFGDFANGAQVVIDQFISSGEQKWGRFCGLTLLLPHGYEGQGPEHSSARLERYLQLCAQSNMQVCVPTTPAQIFHLLSRQSLRRVRKPLIIMSPKSLLRHKEAVSPLSDFLEGHFRHFIPEIDDLPASKVKRIVLCSGKVYYDLLAERRAKERHDVVILRVEQLYPFPEEGLKAEIAQYTKAKTVVWCQEEPRNQGAWYSSQHHMRACLSDKQELVYAGRAMSAAPAVGYLGLHKQQQAELVTDALG